MASPEQTVIWFDYLQITTLEAFIDLFCSADNAREFEEHVLASEPCFLPQCALDVLAGGIPTQEYFQFLAMHVWLLDERCR